MNVFCEECKNFVEESIDYHSLKHRIIHITNYKDELLTEIYIDHVKIAEFYNDPVSAVLFTRDLRDIYSKNGVVPVVNALY